jgi:hypothetical protein
MKWEKIGNNTYQARIDLHGSINTGIKKMVEVIFNDEIYTISLDTYDQIKQLLDGQGIVNCTDSLNSDLEIARKQQDDRISKANL